MVKLVSPNILEKKVRLGTIEIPTNADGKPKYTFNHLKHPKDSPWNLPDRNESLWITLPIEDELFKIAHYMDRNKSYRYSCCTMYVTFSNIADEKKNFHE